MAAMAKTTCGMVLRHLTVTLEAFIVEGKNLGSAKTAAARSAMLAVENAKNVFDYKGVLSKEESEVDKVFQRQLDTLRGITESVRSEINAAYQDVAARVQAFIISLCTCTWRPCLTGINPQYAVITNGNECFVSFFGRFYYAETRGYTPFLQIGNHNFTPVSATTECLKFKASYNFPKVSLERRDIAKATLNVPYENSKVPLPTLYDVRTFSYDVWLGALPTAPCKEIKVTYSWHVVTGYDKKHHRTATVVLNSKEIQPSDSSPIERKVTFFSSEGYEILQKSVQLYFHSKTSKNEVEVAEIAKDRLTVKMKIPMPGSLEFHAEFDESKDISKLDQSVETKVLRWNQSLELPLDKSFTIKYRTFEGKDYIITNVDRTQPYLHVGEKSGKLYLFAIPPQDS